MVKDKFTFGSSPKMREVPPGTAAKFRFNGTPSLVETEWGQKYSFPIVLISHDSYDSLPIDCQWESKSYVAKEVYNAYTKDIKEIVEEDKKSYYKQFQAAYDGDTKWQLTRLDTGQYFLDQL